ncbi:MAG: hypothetical protein K0R34_1761 [Herbinix sp.]|jgi:hypothetical protein|nr:hypothetical protein [Herbinix sp.]
MGDPVISLCRGRRRHKLLGVNYSFHNSHFYQLSLIIGVASVILVLLLTSL